MRCWMSFPVPYIIQKITMLLKEVVWKTRRKSHILSSLCHQKVNLASDTEAPATVGRLHGQDGAAVWGAEAGGLRGDPPPHGTFCSPLTRGRSKTRASRVRKACSLLSHILTRDQTGNWLWPLGSWLLCLKMETVISLYTNTEAWLVKRVHLDFMTYLIVVHCVLETLRTTLVLLKIKMEAHMQAALQSKRQYFLCKPCFVKVFSFKSGLMQRNGTLTHWSLLLCIQYEI